MTAAAVLVVGMAGLMTAPCLWPPRPDEPLVTASAGRPKMFTSSSRASIGWGSQAWGAGRA